MAISCEYNEARLRRRGDRDKVRNARTIRYRNTRYGFTLRLPKWWRCYLAVSSGKGDRPVEYETHFTFKYKGKQYEDIFTVAVFDLTHKEWIKEGYGDSPYVYLGEHRNKVFAYITPSELPYQFIDPKTGEYNEAKYGRAIRLLKRMVNHDVPRIVKSFRFYAKTAVPANVYLSDKVRRRCVCRRRR